MRTAPALTISLLISIGIFPLIGMASSNFFGNGIHNVFLALLLSGAIFYFSYLEASLNNLKNAKKLIKLLRRPSLPVRVTIALTLLWIIYAPIYVYLFEPYDYMGYADVKHFKKIMSFPIAVAWTGLLFFKIIVAPRNQDIEELT